MFKKLRTFLTSSLAVMMTVNVAKAEEQQAKSYDGLSALAHSVDDSNSHLVKTSNKINCSASKMLKKMLGVLGLGWGLFNCIPLFTRVFTGKAEFDNIPVRFRGSQDNDTLNYVLDGTQVIIPLAIGACLLMPERKKTEENSYHKRLLNALLSFGAENQKNGIAPKISINVNNYYQNLNPNV